MIPEWLRRVASVSPADPHGLNPILNRRAPRDARVRQASVLVLFGGSPATDPIARGGLPTDADVLLTQRAATLRQHSGQVAFPGGAADPEDYGAIHTALREAQEETGLDPSGIRPFEQVHRPDQRRLAGAGPPDDAEDAAFGDLQRHVVERDGAAGGKALAQAAEADRGG